MNENLERTEDRAAAAAREAVRAEARQPRTAASFLPVILVAAAILSAIYLFAANPGDTPAPTDAMPVPHVQAPGTTPQPAPAPTPPPQN